jgi:hypothetical protein
MAVPWGSLQPKPGHPLVDATERVMQFSLSDALDPILIDINGRSRAWNLNATLTSVFDLPPQTLFTVNERVDENEPQSKPFSLSGVLFPRRVNGEYDLTYDLSYPDIDDRYNFLRDSGETLPASPTPEALWTFLSNSPVYSIHGLNLFLHRFLVRAIIDIAQQSISPLTRSVLPYFHEKLAFDTFHIDLVANVLIDVYSALFGDSALWDRPKSPIDSPEWQFLISFLAGQIRQHRISPKQLRLSIAPFRPSILSESLPIALAVKLRERLPDIEVHRLISEIFSDRFVCKCFENSSDLLQIILDEDLVCVFPYVTIACYILETLAKRIDKDTTPWLLTAIGTPCELFANLRVVPVVIDPIFDFICETCFQSRIPYLEMTQDELDRVLEILNWTEPILRVAITHSPSLHKHVLMRLQGLLVKRSFEPKGLCLTWFGFLFNTEIVHESTYEFFLQMEPKPPCPGRTSVLLEVNTFMWAMLPAQFPDPAKDAELPPKKTFGLSYPTPGRDTSHVRWGSDH